jgi:hypothetical protein
MKPPWSRRPRPRHPRANRPLQWQRLQRRGCESSVLRGAPQEDLSARRLRDASPKKPLNHEDRLTDYEVWQSKLFCGNLHKAGHAGLSLCFLPAPQQGS